MMRGAIAACILSLSYACVQEPAPPPTGRGSTTGNIASAAGSSALTHLMSVDEAGHITDLAGVNLTFASAPAEAATWRFDLHPDDRAIADFFSFDAPEGYRTRYSTLFAAPVGTTRAEMLELCPERSYYEATPSFLDATMSMQPFALCLELTDKEGRRNYLATPVMWSVLTGVLSARGATLPALPEHLGEIAAAASAREQELVAQDPGALADGVLNAGGPEGVEDPEVSGTVADTDTTTTMDLGGTPGQVTCIAAASSGLVPEHARALVETVSGPPGTEVTVACDEGYSGELPPLVCEESGWTGGGGVCGTKCVMEAPFVGELASGEDAYPTCVDTSLAYQGEPVGCNDGSVTGTVGVCAAPAFRDAGVVHSLVVPAGVSTLRYVALGAAGGSAAPTYPEIGGRGAGIWGQLSVTPHTVVTIVVGGEGAPSGGTGSGGYGGDATDPETGPGAGGDAGRSSAAPGGGGATRIIYDGAALVAAGGGGSHWGLTYDGRPDGGCAAGAAPYSADPLQAGVHRDPPSASPGIGHAVHDAPLLVDGGDADEGRGGEGASHGDHPSSSGAGGSGGLYGGGGGGLKNTPAGGAGAGGASTPSFPPLLNCQVGVRQAHSSYSAIRGGLVRFCWEEGDSSCDSAVSYGIPSSNEADPWPALVP